MESAHQLPTGLNLRKTSFYSFGGTSDNIQVGEKEGYDFAVFDFSNNNADCPKTWNVAAFRVPIPTTATTYLSLSAGLRSERQGDWLLIYQLQGPIGRDSRAQLVEDCFKLIEYARDANFPESLA